MADSVTEWEFEADQLDQGDTLTPYCANPARVSPWLDVGMVEQRSSPKAKPQLARSTITSPGAWQAPVVHIHDLPTTVLHHILLQSPTDNLVHQLTICAQVHPSWWQLCRSSAAYMHSCCNDGRAAKADAGVGSDIAQVEETAWSYNEVSQPVPAWTPVGKTPPDEPRASKSDKVNAKPQTLKTDSEKSAVRDMLPVGNERGAILKTVSSAIDAAWEAGSLNLYDKIIGDAGASALGAALEAMPGPLMLAELILSHGLVLPANAARITSAGLQPIISGCRRGFGAPGLQRLFVSHNPLGDAGLTALATALPPTLEELHIVDIACGDVGFMALANALRDCTSLDRLWCGRNHAGGDGWGALGRQLPNLGQLTEIVAVASKMGCSGVTALIQGLSGAESLSRLDFAYSDIGLDGALALAQVLPQCPALTTLKVTGETTTIDLLVYALHLPETAKA